MHECKIMVVKYIFTEYGQMRQKKIEIKIQLTILT